MLTGKASCQVTLAAVARMLCAASAVVPKWLLASVSTSKARHSASTMTRPGSARRTMGTQLCSARRVRPGQHWRPPTKRTYSASSSGSRLSTMATATGAPT